MSKENLWFRLSSWNAAWINTNHEFPVGTRLGANRVGWLERAMARSIWSEVTALPLRKGQRKCRAPPCIPRRRA
jgi:hypothetical protein